MPVQLLPFTSLLFTATLLPKVNEVAVTSLSPIRWVSFPPVMFVSPSSVWLSISLSIFNHRDPLAFLTLCPLVLPVWLPFLSLLSLLFFLCSSLEYW